MLLAAGVGITPMLAMLRHIVYEGLRKRRVRPTWLIFSARTLSNPAFSDEIDEPVQRAGGAVNVVRVLSDPPGAVFKRDYDVSGRIDMDLLTSFLPFNDYDFYLCGPGAFMQSLYDGLRKLNIADARIHAEAFGPASLLRSVESGDAAKKPQKPAANEAVVTFVKSGKDVRWPPASGTLLELAEAQDIPAEFSCRGGTCRTCRTRIVQGAVSYASEPEFEVGEDEALICCAVPAASDDKAAKLKLEL